VVGIGRSGPKPAPFWLTPPKYRYHALHLVTQLEQIMTVLDIERPEVIVNYAAQGEGAASFGDNAPDFFMTNCVALSRLVLELNKRSYLRRFVQIGSSEVYGTNQNGAKETDPLDETSPYGISKGAFDKYLQVMWRISKFPMNIVRPTNATSRASSFIA
jgi:dTDP-glucose 4,6-dehydratase